MARRPRRRLGRTMLRGARRYARGSAARTQARPPAPRVADGPPRPALRSVNSWNSVEWRQSLMVWLARCVNGVVRFARTPRPRAVRRARGGMQTGFAGSPPTRSRVLHFVVNSQNYHTPTRRSMSERNESADPHETGQLRPVSGNDHIVLRRILRVVLTFALVVYFIATGLFLGLRYVVLPRVD